MGKILYWLFIGWWLYPIKLIFVDLPMSLTGKKTSNRRLNTKDLLFLQRLVVVNAPPNRLIYSEEQLIKMAYSAVERESKILKESADIVNTTVNPDTFFSRYSLMEEKLGDLIGFESYVKFKTALPSDELRKICNMKQDEINRFLVRYFIDTSNKSNDMKTVKGKRNKYQKFYDSLQKYYPDMNQNNINYVESHYASAMQRL